MDRRKALVNLGILTGGMVLLPSCEFSKEKISFALNNLQVTESQESLLKDIVSFLIPEGDLPGAGSLNVHDFVWVMVDDCMASDKQATYLQGLNDFEGQIKKVAGKTFKSQNNKERIQAFKSLTEETSENEPVKAFINTTKQFTMLGYMRSEYIMTKVMPYSLVPGTYGPCEIVDNSKRINLNG